MIWNYKTAYEPNKENMFPGAFWTYRRMIDWSVLPHLHTKHKKQERLNIEKKYGSRNPFTRSMLYGQFQASSEGNSIYEDLHIERMKKAMHGAYTPSPGDVRAAGDISGGGDGQVLMVRQGTEVMLIDEHKEASEIEQAEYWVDTLKYLKIPAWHFTIDGGGIGAPVANYMELRLGYHGVNRFMSNNLPTHDYQFQDRYTELHWLIREMLNQHVLKLPWCQPLLDDMRARRYVEMSKDSKLKTEIKKEHRKRNRGKSPDYLDTLVYLFSDFQSHLFRTGQSMKVGEPARKKDENEPTLMELQAEQDMRGTEDACFSGLEIQPDLAELARRIGA